MSEENEVVIEESNPTNEDHSIDEAINGLFDSLEVTPAEEVEEESDEEVVNEATPEDEEEASEESIDEDGEFSLPNNMPKELQEALSGFDEEAKKQHTEVFKKMQGSFTKKNQDFAVEKKFAESINKAFESNGLNVDPAKKQTLISNYIAFDNLLESNPKDAVKRMMDYAGLKPEDLGANPTPTDSSEDEFLTDTELKTKQTIDALTEKVNQLTNHTTTSKKEAQSKIVNDFINATDDAGEKLHPHFEAVKADMMDLSDVNPKLTIDQLYTKAVRMDDALYEKTIERERKSALSGSDAKRKAEVEKAKKLNRQSRPTSSVDSQVVDEDAQFEQLVVNAGWS